MAADEQYPPATATTPASTSLCAAVTLCCASHASSNVMISSLRPRTPPLAFHSSMASVAALEMSSPILALPLDNGTGTPILIVAPWAPAPSAVRGTSSASTATTAHHFRMLSLLPGSRVCSVAVADERVRMPSTLLRTGGKSSSARAAPPESTNASLHCFGKGWCRADLSSAPRTRRLTTPCPRLVRGASEAMPRSRQHRGRRSRPSLDWIYEGRDQRPLRPGPPDTSTLVAHTTWSTRFPGLRARPAPRGALPRSRRRPGPPRPARAGCC